MNYKLGRFTLRAGRQGLLLDNGRIFSDAPWAQQSRSHEGLGLIYANESIETEAYWMFTRSYSDRFDPAYSPVASHNYKHLFVYHVKGKVLEYWNYMGIFSSEIFEKGATADWRITAGGRVGYQNDGNYLTFNGYYQFGTGDAGEPIRAYYMQSEFRKQLGQSTFRLGAEFLSGNDLSKPQDVKRTFVPLYGVAWKFMGNMNFFTKFPADVNSSGLVNPYLFILQRLNSKMGVRMDSNLFFTQFALLDDKGNASKKYLGAEIDLSFNYRPAAQWEINVGLSMMNPEKSMVLLGKIADGKDFPLWSYLMVSFHPNLLRIKK